MKQSKQRWVDFMDPSGSSLLKAMQNDVEKETAFTLCQYNRYFPLQQYLADSLRNLRSFLDVLDYQITKQLKTTYHKKARMFHPDRGGLEGFEEVAHVSFLFACSMLIA